MNQLSILGLLALVACGGDNGGTDSDEDDLPDIPADTDAVTDTDTSNGGVDHRCADSAQDGYVAEASWPTDRSSATIVAASSFESPEIDCFRFADLTVVDGAPAWEVVAAQSDASEFVFLGLANPSRDDMVWAWPLGAGGDGDQALFLDLTGKIDATETDPLTTTALVVGPSVHTATSGATYRARGAVGTTLISEIPTDAVLHLVSVNGSDVDVLASSAPLDMSGITPGTWLTFETDAVSPDVGTTLHFAVEGSFSAVDRGLTATVMIDNLQLLEE